MPSRQKALADLITLGAKYAPLAYEGLKQGKQPAQEFAERQLSRRNARSIAMEHAAHLVDGSVLPVYEGDQRVWVVFSGEEPIATHPQVETPLKELLRHYDLGKRTPSGTSRRRKRGGEAPAVGESTGAGRRRKRRDKTPAVSEPTGTGWPTAETDSPTTGDDASEGAATTPGA